MLLSTCFEGQHQLFHLAGRRPNGLDGYGVLANSQQIGRERSLLIPLSDYSWGRARIIGYTEDGSHWYQKVDSTVILIPKEVMKETEDLHIRPEHGMPGYDPIWEYNWKW